MKPSVHRKGEAQVLRLNDVCVQKVFTFLQLHDLCNAAEVCKRFKAIAEEVFKTVYADKPIFDVLKLIEGKTIFHQEWSMIRTLTEKFFEYAEQLFRNFGLFIDALRLTGAGEYGGMDENKLLTLVKTYCPSLKQLTLVRAGHDDDFSTELLPLFGGLEKLSILNIFGVDMCESFVALFSDCHNLKYLNVCSVPATLWVKHKFPKLETLIISNDWEYDDESFESFLKNHENLRTLRYDDDDIYSGFFRILSTASPQLETFYCNAYAIDDLDFCDDYNEVEENILQLSKLKSLKRLTFSCETRILNALLAAFEKEDSPLEYFEIFDCEMDNELIVGLSKLKSMKTLKLTRCDMTAETFTSVSHHLNRLDKVVIEDIEGFDLDAHKFAIGGNVFTVNTLKKTKKLKKRSIQDSSIILIVLHDDCLVDIFKFLPLQDLCNVADVCKSFRRNAQTVFQLQRTRFKTRTISEDKTDMHLAEQLFRNFGRFMQELSLDGGRCLKSIADQETLIYLASKYCDYTKLKVLILDQISIEVDMRWILCYLDLFHLLPKLQLYSSRLNGSFGKFLSVCKIPVILVYSPSGSPEWMYHTFRNLQSMSLFDTWLPQSAMDEFIKLNGHLFQLIIHQSMISTNIFKTVADAMPNLVGFCFAGSHPRVLNERKNVMHLARLKSLNALTLNCNSFSLKSLIDAFLTASTPLSQLNIYFGNVDMELLEKLSHIKSPLTDLTLRRVNMKSVSLIDVVKKLPDLKKLDIDIKGIVARDVIKSLPFAEKLNRLKIGSETADVQIDIVTYKLILEIVKSRQKPNKLCIHICSPKRHVYVPKHLLRESSYWLQIENEINENCNAYMTDSDSAEKSDEESVISFGESLEESAEESMEESAEESLESTDGDDVGMDIV